MRSTFSRGVLLMISVQVLALVISYGLNLFLARQLSVADYGRYSVLYNALTLLAPLACGGLLYAALRFVTEANHTGNTLTVKTFTRFSTRVTLLISAIIAAIGVLIGTVSGTVWWTLGALLLPAVALFDLYTHILRAINALWLSVFIQRVGRIALLWAGYLLVIRWLDASLVPLMVVFGVVHILLVGLQAGILTRRTATDKTASSVPRRQWGITGLRLLGIQSIALLLLRVPILAVGAADGDRAAALYGILTRVALLAGFGTEGAGILFSIRVAPLIARQQHRELANLMRQMIFIALLFVIIAGATIIYFAPHIFAIFGSEYIPAAGFIGLAIAIEAVRAIRNPFPYVLNLSGYEHISLALAAGIVLTGLPLLLIGASVASINGVLLAILLIEFLILISFGWANERYLKLAVWRHRGHTSHD